MTIRPELYRYDIWPKIIPCGRKSKIHIAHRWVRPFEPGEYTIQIRPLSEASPGDYPERKGRFDITASPDENNEFSFEYDFPLESEYFIRIVKDGKRVVQLSVYAVEGDLIGRYPLTGDQHMHSFYSDGSEHPAIVCANYRAFGYDYIPITDHRRYYSSLEAINFYRDVDCGLEIIPGEEIHLPDNDIHIVNFGGKYSINGLLAESAQNKEKGEGAEFRSFEGFPCPPVMTADEYRAEVNALIPTLNIPDDIEKFTYAACVWIFNHIRKAEGVGIYCHPYWISDMFQVPENITEYMLTQHPFDAYELLGGEVYYEQNGFQIASLNDILAKVIDYPTVASTDSHCSYPTSPISHAVRTITFSPENKREAILDSIRGGFTVAVDATMPEERLHGSLRLTKYAWFVLRHYFALPGISGNAAEEGRLMAEYALSRCPDRKKELADRIAVLKKDYIACRNKYISF